MSETAVRQNGVLLWETELAVKQESAAGWNPSSFSSALVVGRFHGQAIGQVAIDLTPISGPDEVREIVRSKLAAAIDSHLEHDRTLGGIGTLPACVQARRRALDSAPLLTVVIPTRDRPIRLRSCLQSVLGGSYPRDRLEIFVVDNASSTDDTKAVVEDIGRTARVRYLYEGKSGSASARNRALSEVRTEYAVFTDDDTSIDEHWLIEIVRAFQSEDGVDIVSGLLLPRCLDTAAQRWFEAYGGFSRGFERRVFDVQDNWAYDEPLFPFSAGLFGTGNNMAFRTQVLKEIGGFDPALGNGTPARGGVDSEVLLRSVILGHKLVYQPTAVVYHEHRPDLESLRRQIFSYGSGLAAYMLKTLTNNPSLIPLFLELLPKGLAFELDPRSRKNAGKRADYPKTLTVAELVGIAYGPLAYARSRHKYGPHLTPKAERDTFRRRPRITG